MRWPTLKCPFCGGILPNREVRPGTPLKCPTCSRLLQPARWQLRLSGLIALGLTVALSRLFGIQGFWLLAATVILWFPVYVAWDFAFMRLVTPRFEAYMPKDSGLIR
jgi:hypothetical protein